MLNTLKKQEVVLLILTLLCAALILTSGLTRPLFPVNETLYTGVAWDMWTHHHFLVPHMDGHLYNQKPPLFFWLVDAGWAIFGVNHWWPRVLPGLCAIGTLACTFSTAKTLFLDNEDTPLISILVLLGCAYFAYYLPRSRLDQLLSLCVMIAILGIAQATQRRRIGWLWFAIGNGLGLLTKGPITLLFTMPITLLAPYYCQLTAKRWFSHLSIALLGSLFVAALWAVPLIVTHPEYAQSILWDQTANRLSGNSALHPWYYYLVRLPFLLAPWLLWPSAWRAGLSHSQSKTEKWLRNSMLLSLIGLSCLAPKASRFLIPWVPLFALWLAYQLTHARYRPLKYQNDIVAFGFVLTGLATLFTPSIALLFDSQAIWPQHFQSWWGLGFILLGLFWLKGPNTLFNTVAAISISVAVSTLLFYTTIIHAISPLYDVEAFSKTLDRLEISGHPIAYIGDYDDRFQFLGQLKKPITSVNNQSVSSWALKHHNGVVIQILDHPHHLHHKPLWQQRFRGDEVLLLWHASHFQSPKDPS